MQTRAVKLMRQLLQHQLLLLFTYFLSSVSILRAEATDFSTLNFDLLMTRIEETSQLHFSIEPHSFLPFNFYLPDCKHQAQKIGKVIDYPLAWPDHAKRGTHELTYNHKGGKVFWVTGTIHDAIARVELNGKAKFFPTPPGSIPHGIVFDAKGRLWITLEGSGLIARVNKHGELVEFIDLRFFNGSHELVNPGPHGLAVALDGITLWFTGKESSTVGKVNPNHSVEHFVLPTPNSEPIYIIAGSDGNMWCTELTGNKIARITQEGSITEFIIPTPNSRPIVITPSPNGHGLWFSEEAGNKVAHISLKGKITEFPVPMTQENVILAGLTFDHQGNLWTQSYVNENNPLPLGPDYIVKFDKAINKAVAGNISRIPITYYQVPTRNSVMHRIEQGPDGNMWFTELATDKIGKVILN